jgi:beta-glucosidase
VDGPIKSLRGFERVNIKAGETVSVEIPFKADLFNPATGKMEQASGEYIIYYGGTSDEAGLKQITVTL